MSNVLRCGMASLAIATAGCGDATRLPGPDGTPAPRSALTGTAGAGSIVNLRSRVAANRCIDVSGGSGSPGARLLTYTCHTGANQKFTWLANGELRVYGTLCIGARTVGAPGEEVVTQRCDGGARQRWEATAASQIRSQAGSCLAVPNDEQAIRAILVVAECGDAIGQQWDEHVVSPPPPVASVSLAPDTLAVEVAASASFVVTLRDSAGGVVAGRVVTWTSDDTAVAVVSAAGLVTGVAPGTTGIVATSEGHSAGATVTVLPGVASLAVAPSSLTLVAGHAASLTATARDRLGNVLTGRAVTWRSGDESVATVSVAGVVTAVARGATSITATSEGVEAASALTVLAPVHAVSLEPSTLTLPIGVGAQVAATLRDADGGTLDGRLVTWESGDPAVVTVSATGLVTAHGVGTATITATSEGRSAHATVTAEAALPPPPPSCVNEPAGLTAVTSTAWDAVPPDLALVDADGWGFIRDRANVSIVNDPTAPRSPWAVAAARFPAAWEGGRSPFRLERPFAQRYTTLYQCLWLKHSENFTDNGNAGTKVAFYRGDDFSHYWAFDGGPNDGHDGFYFFFGLQDRFDGTRDRSIRSAFSATPLGVWRQYEILVVGNTPGLADGALRVWVDGTLVLDVADVDYWPADRIAGFHGVSWDPTYGGGLNPVPFDMYQYIDHWYVSGR